MRILVMNGPNLNRLGERNQHIYGRLTLAEINGWLQQKAAELNVQLDFFQSNCEGVLIDRLQQAELKYQAVIFNPGAYSHYSYALHDAVEDSTFPVIEVHLSNIADREPFRRQSVVAPACVGQISGFGRESYLLALYAAINHVQEAKN